MNSYFWGVLLSLALVHAIEFISQMMNLRSLEEALPGQIEGIYDAEDYAKSQQYTRAATRFGLVRSATDFFVLMAFWLLGGFRWLDDTTRLAGLGELPTGLLFIGTVLLGREVLALPFRAYKTFVLEERFGFNKTTARTFVSDRMKRLFLAVALGAPILSALLALFLWAGPRAWIYAWAVMVTFSVGLRYFAPNVIMPLFNEFTSLEEGDLRRAIVDYAKSVEFPVNEIFVMDGSRRSSRSNAFFMGFGKNRRIALLDTLTEKHTIRELVSVLAHEVGHYKGRHVVKGATINALETCLLFFLLSLLIGNRGLFEAFGVINVSVHAGLVFFAILYTPLSFLLRILMNEISRRNEFEADRYAVKTVGDGEPMIAALKGLSVANLVNLTPHPMYVLLNYSHPPVLKRIEAIRKAGLVSQGTV
jgi:STE24 endopeptidase